MPAHPSQAHPAPARRTRLTASAALLVAALTGLALTTTRAPLPGPTDPAATHAAPAVASTRINLNTATAAELQLLPRIGPALSARIIEDRAANGPYETIEALDRVRGIGPRTIHNIRDHATVNE